MASRVFPVKRPTARKRAVRFKSGKLASEPRKPQEPHGLVIAETPFRKLAREISKAIKPKARWGKITLKTLQERVEGLLIHRFANANLIAMRYGRICIEKADMKVAALIESKGSGDAEW